MRQNLALVGFLFLFLMYLAVTEKQDELQVRWDSQFDHSNPSDFIYEDESEQEHVDYSDSISI